MTRFSAALLQIALLAISFHCLTAEIDHTRATSTHCLNNAQCTENAVCSLPQGFCQCRTGYVYFEDICVKVATQLGDPCLADIQCEVAFGTDAKCEQKSSSGTCACRPGSHFAENKCHVSILLGDKCKTRSDCFTISGASVYCVDSICTCHQHFHPNSERNDCLPDKMLGDRCKNDDDCVSNDALCYGIVCSCKAGFVPAMDFKRCLKVAYRLGDECEIDTQCLQNLPLSVCKSQQCDCMEGCHRLEDKCWRTTELGETCDDWRQCTTVSNLTGSVTCDGKHKCKCTAGYIINQERDDCKIDNNSSPLQTSISKFIILILIIVTLIR